MNTKSFLYQELSQEKLGQLCLHALGEEMTSAKLLSGGLFNTTYRVKTQARNMVLRLGPVNRHLLLPYEDHLMRAEAEVLPVLQARGIPTSTLLAWDESRTLVNRDWMMVDCLPAEALSVSALPKEAWARLQRQTGVFMRRMHGITAAELPVPQDKPFGRYALVTCGQGCATWREAILQEVAQWMEMARKADMLPGEVLDKIDACFQHHAPLMDAVGQANLSHCDLWEGNVLVTRDGELAAIIDCDRAMLGDPDFDLSMRWMMEDAFLQGYGREADAAPEACVRRQLYRLIMALENAYVYLAEYDDSASCDRELTKAYTLLDKLLKAT